MKKWLLRISLPIAVLAGALLASVYIYLQHPKFGELPSGDRLSRTKASPHYANGRFCGVKDDHGKTTDRTSL
jgi:hypothetical protein